MKTRKLDTSTTARALMQAKIDANLTKNEGTIFDVLIAQTLFYGKTHDCITDRTLAGLAGGMRIDHARTARDAVINKGVFDAVESQDFEVCYSIPEKFIKKGKNYAPHLNNDYSSAPTTPDLDHKLDPKDDGFSAQQIAQLKDMIRDICGQQRPKEQKSAENKENPKFGNKIQNWEIKSESRRVSPKIWEISPEFGSPIHYINPDFINPTPLTPTDTSAANTKNLQLKSEGDGCGGGENIISPSANQPKEGLTNNKSASSENITLPKAISQKNKSACLQALAVLSADQIKDVIKTFDYKASSDVIKSPAGLFIYLAKASKEGRLIVPENPVSSSKYVAPTADEKEAEAKKEEQERIKSGVAWLVEASKRDGTPIDKFAKQMGMENILQYINPAIRASLN